MASSPAALLLGREFARIKKNPTSPWFCVHDMIEDNVFCWDIFVVGPRDTLYEGGVYRALLRFPPDYPMNPPSLQFKSKLLHPNVYRDGKVCVTTLQVMHPGADPRDSALFWRPILGVEQVVLSVISLLSDPNSDDPADLSASNMFLAHPDEFRKICAENARLSLEQLPPDVVPPQEAAVNPQGNDKSQRAKAATAALESCTSAADWSNSSREGQCGILKEGESRSLLPSRQPSQGDSVRVQEQEEEAEASEDGEEDFAYSEDELDYAEQANSQEP